MWRAEGPDASYVRRTSSDVWLLPSSSKRGETVKPLNVLSYGGGVNSSALFFHLLDTGRPLDLVIFADTGEEMPATYDAVQRMAAACQDRGIRFETVRSHH